MNLKAPSPFSLLLFSSCLYLLSCTAPEEKLTPKISATDAVKVKPSVIETTAPELNAAGEIDTSLLKCYINSYSLPYLVKIDKEYFRVKADNLPAFISSQQNELKKYRVHLLITKNTSDKKKLTLANILTANNIIDFEEVVDGTLQR